MPETPVEQRLERRGLAGTADLSATLAEIEDEAAKDARLREQLNDWERRRGEERTLVQQRRAAVDAGREAHVPGQGAAAGHAMQESDGSDDDMTPAMPSIPTMTDFPGAPAEVNASAFELVHQIGSSTLGFKTFFITAALTNYEDWRYARVVQVSLVTGDASSSASFSGYLKPTVRVASEAYDYHGLDEAEFAKLGARDASKVLTEMVAFIEEHSAGRRPLLVGWAHLGFEVSSLVQTMRECPLDVSPFLNASYLDVKKVAPDVVVKVGGRGAELEKTFEELFVDYSMVRLPTRHYDAEVRGSMVFIVFAMLLEMKGWSFEAAAAIADGAEAVPGLVETPTVVVPDLDDTLPATSTVQREVDCWRGFNKVTGEETFSINSEDIAEKWGISTPGVSFLSRIDSQRQYPWVHKLAETFEVVRLREKSHTEIGSYLYNSRRLAAWEARIDGRRLTQTGMDELSQSPAALRDALKSVFSWTRTGRRWAWSRCRVRSRAPGSTATTRFRTAGVEAALSIA